jgi:hypothetical protein
VWPSVGPDRASKSPRVGARVLVASMRPETVDDTTQAMRRRAQERSHARYDRAIVEGYPFPSLAPMFVRARPVAQPRRRVPPSARGRSR